MHNHDQKGLFDRARALKPSRLGQPKGKPDQHKPIEAGSSDAGTCEQDMSHIQSRWQRIKGNPTVQRVLAYGSLAVVGAVTYLVLTSNEEDPLVRAADFQRIPESTKAASEGIREETTRKSPNAHTVKEYERTQHYGPGSNETKTIKVSAYPRGGNA